jgi:hypothetical protein
MKALQHEPNKSGDRRWPKRSSQTQILETQFRRANEMTIDEAPAAPVYGGFGTVLVR